MTKVLLGGSAILVAGLVVFLVIEAKRGTDDAGADVVPEPVSAPAAPETTVPTAATPRRMASEDQPEPAEVESALPSEQDVAEAKERVMAEHPRSPNRAAEIIDNNFKARPMRSARKSFHRGDYPKALQGAEDALAVEPEAKSARVLAVLAACGMGEKAIAQAHADKLDDMRKARVARRCDKFGVDLAGIPNMPDDM